MAILNITWRATAPGRVQNLIRYENVRELSPLSGAHNDETGDAALRIPPEDLSTSHWSWRLPVDTVLARDDSSEVRVAKSLNLRGVATATKRIKIVQNNLNLQYLSIWTRYTGQPVLDAIGTAQNLLRLDIGTLRAPDLSPLEELQQLEYLRLVSASSAVDLAPIGALRSLVSLSLGISPKVSSLDGLFSQGFPQLRALALGSSSEGRLVHVDDLSPIGNASNLEYLSLFSIRTKAPSLGFAYRLPKLKALQYHTAIKFSPDEVQEIRSRNVRIEAF